MVRRRRKTFMTVIVNGEKMDIDDNNKEERE
jgi:hypothetical protein